MLEVLKVYESLTTPHVSKAHAGWLALAYHQQVTCGGGGIIYVLKRSGCPIYTLLLFPPIS